MYIHVVEAEKLLYFVANWSSRNIENVFFLSLFETRQRAKESYRELKRTSKLLYKEWFLYKVRIPISGQLTILQNRFSLKYQQIKNTWTERTKYFPTQKTPTMHLTGWHLLLVSKLSDWLDFWCNNFHPSSRGDEVKGREEHPVWGDGESRRVTADSKPEKHQQFVVLVLRDSASDNSSVSLHHVREAFGIFFVDERLILALWQGPWLHSRRVPPEVGQCGSGKNH